MASQTGPDSGHHACCPQCAYYPCALFPSPGCKRAALGTVLMGQIPAPASYCGLWVSMPDQASGQAALTRSSPRYSCMRMTCR
jgi:hypothetical protein